MAGHACDVMLGICEDVEDGGEAGFQGNPLIPVFAGIGEAVILALPFWDGRQPV